MTDTDTPRRCPECGNSLPADAPEGLCPQCLMKEALASEATGSPSPDDVPTTDAIIAPEAAGQSSAASPARGRPFEPPSVETLDALLPNLKVLELLGAGGMGAVYKAKQTSLDRTVAVKVLPPQIVRGPAFEERFSREARALARLTHSGIVAVHDFGHVESPDGDLYYIVMEYVDGTNLRQKVHAGTMSPNEALAIVPQVCEALQFAHDEGIVHRDIKPENILVDKKGRVKIADFGLAKLVAPAPTPGGDEPAPGRNTADYTLTATGGTMGTPHYMAPEQFESAHAVDHRADIFSLGVVFYEMLTGELPLGRFAPPSQKVQIDVRLDEVVLRALEKEPEHRYQKVSELKTEVETISGQPVNTARRAVGFENHLATTLWAAFVSIIAIGSVAMPWLKNHFGATGWGWRHWQGITMAVVGVIVIATLTMTARIRPRPTARIMVLLLSSVAMLGCGWSFLNDVKAAHAEIGPIDLKQLANDINDTNKVNTKTPEQIAGKLIPAMRKAFILSANAYIGPYAAIGCAAILFLVSLMDWGLTASEMS